ncbi:hypothetical protein H0H92_006636, partial [Tricholoma furcatifolium]
AEKKIEYISKRASPGEDPNIDPDVFRLLISRVNELKIRHKEMRRIDPTRMMFAPEELEESQAKVKLVPFAVQSEELEDGTIMFHMFFRINDSKHLRVVSIPQKTLEDQDYDPEDENFRNPRNIVAFGDALIAVAAERANLGEVVNEKDQGTRAYLKMIHKRLALAREEAVKLLRLDEKVSAGVKYLAAKMYFHDAMNYLYRADMAEFARFKAVIGAEVKEHTEAAVESQNETHTEATVEAKEEGITSRILRVASEQAIVLAVYERVSTAMEKITTLGEGDGYSE